MYSVFSSFQVNKTKLAIRIWCSCDSENEMGVLLTTKTLVTLFLNLETSDDAGGAMNQDSVSEICGVGGCSHCPCMRDPLYSRYATDEDSNYDKLHDALSNTYLLAPHQNPKLEDHPLPAVCDCFLSIFRHPPYI
jgi:hypothetical protein